MSISLFLISNIMERLISPVGMMIYVCCVGSICLCVRRDAPLKNLGRFQDETSTCGQLENAVCTFETIKLTQSSE